MRGAGAAPMIASLLVAAAALMNTARVAGPPGASAQAVATGPRETLRVGMWTLWHDRELMLSSAGPDRRITLRTCADCATLTLENAVHVRADGGALDLIGNGRNGKTPRISLIGGVILAAHGETVTLPYTVAISARAGVLIIAVTMPIESYVERVVASESGAQDNAESLKALAIAVRSFALHEAHGHHDYDLCDSTHCQLLHWGANGGRERAAHAAALATAGETLWFHGERALAYFGKDCGGRTASPIEVWPRAKAVSYLPSQPDPYCIRDGGKEWSSQISRADLVTALAAHGLAPAGWQNLVIARRGESGRAVVLRIDEHEIPAEDFRLAVGESLGWNKIPSAWFEVSRQGDSFAFHGRGWGHGVGLCQKGSAAMGAQGRSAREILAQYFPGAAAADEASGREWASLAGGGFQLESLDPADAAYLPELNRARAEAAQRSGLSGSVQITVRAFVSTQSFRAATLAPGWVAAFTEGDWIGTQPLRVLASRHLLADTMRHEFLHALVEHEAGPRTPLWLREGLVELWSEPSGDLAASIARRPVPSITPEATDTALAHASTEDESENAHRAAEWYAAQLLMSYGREHTLQWLQSGVPAEAVAGLGQR